MTAWTWILVAFALVATGYVALPSADAGEDSTYPRVGVVTGTRVNVRPGPSRNHFPFAQFVRDTRVVVSAKKGEWYRIYLPADSTCWVHGDYLTPVKTARENSNEQTLRVVGSRVRVRVSPDTKYTPLGHVDKGDLLRSTGARDRTGDWVECYAPLSATAYIHEDLVKLGRSVASSDVKTVLASYKQPSVKPDEVEEPEVAEGALPRFHSGRLHEIHERYRQERTKPIEEWDFSTLKNQLRQITSASEDLGEIDNAEMLLGVIEEAESLRAELAEIEQGRKIAREKIADSKKKERDAPKGVHRIPPKQGGDSEFLASGWVVSQGKHSKVGATHKLMKGNHVLFFIKSDKVRLDDYVNKRVGIRGYKSELPSEAGADLVRVTEIRVLSK